MDSDTKKYTKQVLISWKQQAEEKARDRIRKKSRFRV